MSVIWTSVPRLIRAYLVEQGVGLDYAADAVWPIAINEEQNKPANLITLFSEAPIKKYRTVLGGVYEQPVVGIRVRSTQFADGEYKAKQIQEALDGLSRWTWVGDSSEYNQTVLIQNCQRARGIFPMGKDENNRWCFSLEYALAVQSITPDGVLVAAVERDAYLVKWTFDTAIDAVDIADLPFGIEINTTEFGWISGTHDHHLGNAIWMDTGGDFGSHLWRVINRRGISFVGVGELVLGQHGSITGEDAGFWAPNFWA